MVQFYHTTIESVDFRKDTENSRQEINFWVESQSQGKQNQTRGSWYSLPLKRKRAGPAFQIASLSGARRSPVWTGSGAACAHVSQLTCLGVRVITMLLCCTVKVNCLLAKHNTRGMLIIFVSFNGLVKRLGRESSCSEGHGNR